MIGWLIVVGVAGVLVALVTLMMDWNEDLTGILLLLSFPAIIVAGILFGP